MSKFQRVQNIAIGLSMLVGAGILLVDSQDGCLFIMYFLALSLMGKGISELLYYITMARFMVGGKLILFIGVVLTDIGFFTLSLADESKLFVMLYLLGFHAFAGLVNILRSLEALRYKSAHWRINMAQGVVSILMLLTSLFFSHDENILAYLYSAGLIYSACLRIASAFRRSAVVFIQ